MKACKSCLLSFSKQPIIFFEAFECFQIFAHLKRTSHYIETLLISGSQALAQFLNMLSKAKIVSKIVSSALLTACIALVAWKSSICFMKYLDKPKAIDVSEEETRNHILPSITICPLWDNTAKNLKPPEVILGTFAKCKLDPKKFEFDQTGPWSSNVSTECFPPDNFHQKAFPTAQDLPIISIRILFWDKSDYYPKIEDPSLNWSQIPYFRAFYCNSLTFSKTLTDKGKYTLRYLVFKTLVQKVVIL